MGSRVRRRYRLVQEQFAAISTCLQENLSGMRVVKAFARRLGEIDHFTQLNDEYVERNRRLIYLYSTFFPFTFLISGLSMVFILWLGRHPRRRRGAHPRGLCRLQCLLDPHEPPDDDDGPHRR